jgi:hypothetical protein
MQWTVWLLAVAIAAGAAGWVFVADRKRAVSLAWLTALLRGLVVLLTLLLFLLPDIIITKNIVEKPVIYFLQDNSLSVAGALGRDSSSYRSNAETLMRRLGQNFRLVRLGFGGTVQKDSLFNYSQPVTDIANALSYPQTYFDQQNVGAIILATDGRFNQGANPLYSQSAMRCPVYTVAIGDSAAQKDLKIGNAHANKTVTLHSNFEIRGDLIARLCSGTNTALTLKENGVAVTTVPISVSGTQYMRSFSMSLKAEKAGLHHYTLNIPAVEGEKNTANNTADVIVEVTDEKKKILILSAAPHPDINAIKNSLSGVATYSVSIGNADKLPANFNEYDAIILHGLPNTKNNLGKLLAASKKPFWLILTNQTNTAAVNELQDITRIALTQGQTHTLLPTANPAFNTFILPQQVQQVLEKMPPLSSNIVNMVSGPGTAEMVLQHTTGSNFPLWMLQQAAVPTAVLCGEGIWRWRFYEYKNYTDHNVVDECIRQTVAFLCAGNKEKPFSIVFGKNIWSDREPVLLNGYLLNANHEQINTPDVRITITDSNKHASDFTLEKSGTSYSLNLGVHAAGTYRYTASVRYDGKDYNASGSFTVGQTVLEDMETGADYPMLYSLAKQYGGAIVPANNIVALADSISRNEHIKPVIRTSTESVPLIDKKWYFFLILLFATAEWLLRRYLMAQ